MIWQSLQKLMERAPEVLEMVRDDPDIEDWQEFNINLAAEHLDAVYDSLKFQSEYPGIPKAAAQEGARAVAYKHRLMALLERGG